MFTFYRVPIPTFIKWFKKKKLNKTIETELII